MIGILGDLHGNIQRFIKAYKEAVQDGAVAMIQLGDFWLSHNTRKQLSGFFPKIPILIEDGNHEYYPFLHELGVYTKDQNLFELSHNVYYVRRGSVLTIDNRRIGFLGGAGSIDYKSRIPGTNWWAEEQITDEDVARLIRNGPVDFLCTHTAPASVERKLWNNPIQRIKMLQAFHVRMDWFDPSGVQLEKAWEVLGYPDLYCGHFHESRELVVPVADKISTVRVLDIGELVLV